MKTSLLTIAVLSTALLTGCASGGAGMSSKAQGAALSHCKNNGLSIVVYTTDQEKVSAISCIPHESDIAREAKVDNTGKKLRFWAWIFGL